MATKVKPSRLQVSGTPQVGQVPVYVDEDTFQWGAGGGGGTGDVSGPASSTDGDIVLFDGATGKLIKDSGVGLSSKLDAAALSNNAYGGGWNGDTTHTPTKDALYDKIHTMDVEIGNKAADTSVVKLTGNQTISGTKTFSTSPVVPSKTTDATNTGTAIATEAQVYKVDSKVSQLFGLGKFLSLWNATTGLPVSFPLSTPYAYTTGDYFLVETISSATPPVNYRPTGSSYTGTASTVVESDELEVGDVYIYDGSAWLLQSNHWKTVTFANIAGDPYDNTNLSDALTAKQDELVSGTNIRTINGTSILGSGDITTPVGPTYTAGTGIDITSDTISTTSNFGKSTTAAATVQKEVSIPGITTLNVGQVVHILPSTTSTVANSTLKVNNFTAYPMRYNNAAITTTTDSQVRPANIVTSFVFDGTYWQFIGHGLDNNTTYSAMTTSEATTGTSTSARTISASVLKGAIQTHAPVTSVNGQTGDVVFNAGEGIEIKDFDYSAMQGPAPTGYHVPSREEWVALRGILITTFSMAANATTMGTYLKMSMAGYRLYSSSSVDSLGSFGGYWSSTAYSTEKAYAMYFSSSSLNPQNNYSRAYGLSVRCFKDTPVTPDSSWTTLYDGSSVATGAGVFYNATDGLISVSGDGATWYTIQDKNLGATTVYNQGDAVTDANCGYFYQWGNNYGFAHSGALTTSSTQVDASSYGPGNYYSSSTFITRISSPYDWSSVQNDNLWGGVTGVIKNAITNTGVLSVNGQTGNVIISGGGIQLAPNSEYDIAYQWYGRQSTFENNLTQYYTDTANDTAFFTIDDE